MGRYITSVIIVCMNILMLLVITGQTNQQVSSPKTISSWIQQNHHLHHHHQPSSINHRSIRSVKWEWSIDALKCSLKMMSLQISRYHNNMIMCCGLWKAKAMLKESALAVCEQPNNSIAVFDEMITEDLIYSQFSRSLLGDETLDCAAYPEGSPSCDRLFSLLSVAVILLIITLITVFSGFCAAVFCTFYWRRKYIIVSSNEKYQDTNYHKANSLSDLSVDSGSGNKSASKKSPLNRMMNLFSPPKSKRTDMINARDAMRRQLTNNNASKLSVVNNRKVIDGNCTPSDGRCSSASTSSSAVHSQKDVRVQ